MPKHNLTAGKWDKQIEEQLKSGMKPKDFCQMHGHNYSNFINAKRLYNQRIKALQEIESGKSFLDKLKRDREDGTNEANNLDMPKIDFKLPIAGEIMEEDKITQYIASAILDKTKYVLDYEMNKMINAFGVEKDLKQINVNKLKDLSVAVLKTIFENNISQKKLQHELLKTELESKKVAIAEEKLRIEKIKIGLIKDEMEKTDNGFVEALKNINVWGDD